MTALPDTTVWLHTAEVKAMGWDDETIIAVLDLMPYKPGRFTRPDDWLILVAHVSTAKGETPIECATRLASFVSEWTARYGTAPSLKGLANSQEGTT